MHLHSLELFGFKSFADKTVLNFHEGITSIVGPNGCGKSNVLDAMRWVLGEQSAKSLRGTEMADVIFNGSDTRKPLSFAEVSLTLSDCATDLGVDWHEVRVTRRIYRDGNSEYFLNKTPCRLRDIQNIFADTGVGRGAYSMMEQGKIDLILSSRPEDRRAVFEEAAGITKYKTQKREALRKLEATEANLVRVGDIIKEVKRQIGSLQRQAGKARRYQALLADLQVLDTYQSREHLASLEHELIECREKLQELQQSERTTREKIEQSENVLSKQRLGLDQMDSQIAAVRAEVEQLQSEMAAHRNRIEFNQQRTDEIRQLISRAEEEIAAAEIKRTRQAAEIRELDASVEKTRASLAAKEGELRQFTERLALIRKDRAERAEELKTLAANYSRTEGRVSTAEDEVGGMIARREATAEYVKKLEREVEAAEAKHTNANKALDEARRAIDGEHQKVGTLLEAVKADETALLAQRNALDDATRALTNSERSVTEKESRLEILKQLNEEGEGLTEGSQALLKGSDELKEFRSTVAGSLVAQLDVDPKFVGAVETALGRNLHAIVVQDEKLAREILHRLRKKKLGQAALLIPRLGSSSSTHVTHTLPQGAIAWATEKVVAPLSVEPLVRKLLAGVAIFDDLESAWTAKNAAPDLACATLAGEFLSAEGIVFGGSSTVHKESLLERKSRIAALTLEHGSALAEREQVQHRQASASVAMETATRKLEEARAAHRAAELAQSAATSRIAVLEREVDLAGVRLDDLRSEHSTLHQQISSADERIAALQESLTAVRATVSEEEKRRIAAEQAQNEAILSETKATEQLNELRLAVATEQQRYDGLIGQRAPVSARTLELTETIETRQREIEEFEARIESQADDSKNSQMLLAQHEIRQDERKNALTALAAKRAETAGALNADETAIRTIRDSLDGLHERRAAQQVRESQLQMKIDNLIDHVQRRYHMDLRTSTQDKEAFTRTLHAQLKRREKSDIAETAKPTDAPASEAEVDRLIADLAQQLDNMGPVNLEAVQEYDELEQRYQFLEQQNNDLTSARRELLDVIARINETTQTLFAETFAQVRNNFREMFSELFGGGRADLGLMDENDPLNCGIEITAKPPGKQLQSVSLLSGGERTMTAVALLFAIYMVRPSPFCVLDEMDAALDETNINRFIRVLERFVAQSQFIIITHNKRTIAKADVIYGVTMEERGISKLVGMKLAERPENYSTLPQGNGNPGNGRQAVFPLEAGSRKSELASVN
jgi:chromosome segregation protein